MSACRSCSAPITWAITPTGKRIPLDAEPCREGTIRVDDGVAVTIAGLELELGRDAGELFYLAHFATCPDAGAWRRA